MMDVLLKSKDYSPAPVDVEVKSLLNALLVADWKQALIARGYGWHVDVGSFTTPITGGGAGTAFDQDQPEFGLSVASGYTIIPVRFHVAAMPGIQTTDSHESEILIAVDRVAAYAGDGTVTTETPINMRTSAAGSCPASCFSAATGNITNPTLGMELMHVNKLTDVQGTAATVNLYDLVALYEPQNPPFLVGPCAVYGYWGGDVAVTGFANLDFIVIPSALISTLT